jgi:hypothetical protein
MPMMGPASSSCEAGNVYAQLTVVLFHGLALVNYSNKWKNRGFLLLTILASVYCLVIRNIHRGIFAHLFMGMMAIEAAARIVRHPLIVLVGSEAILGVVFFLPNFYAVMEETLFSIVQEPVCCHLDIHGLSEFANAHFYDKQHAQLHGTQASAPGAAGGRSVGGEDGSLHEPNSDPDPSLRTEMEPQIQALVRRADLTRPSHPAAIPSLAAPPTGPAGVLVGAP